VELDFVEVFELDLARVVDPLADDAETFSGVFAGEILVAQAGTST